MNIEPATPSGALTGGPSSSVSSGAGGHDTTSAAATPLDANFDMFLRLLTTQLKNQDPLNPMDSADFAVQLATFSGVEQQTKTNDLLKTIGEQIGQSGMNQLAGWIGMDVRTVAPTEFSGAPISLSPQPRSDADTVVLVVKGSNGAEVANNVLPLSSDTFKWDGRTADGTSLPNGTYNFELQNYRNGELIGTDPVASYSRVKEAQIGDAGTELILAGGARIQSSEVTALRPAE